MTILANSRIAGLLLLTSVLAGCASGALRAGMNAELAQDFDRAVIEYWGVVRYRGRDETIAGIAVIRFGPDGLVRDQHDYWNAHEGRREPSEGWGR